MKTYKEFRKSIGFPVKERKVEEVIRPKEPLVEKDVLDQLRSVAKKKGNKEVEIELNSGTSVTINSEIADNIIQTFDSLNSTNKKKMQKNMNKDTNSFMKIMDFALSNTPK